MRSKYGESVRVEYVDFADPEMKEQFASVLAEIESKHLAFPVTAVDDRFISEGHVDYWTIANALEETAQGKK